uniref:Ig-like domain-containing protein n=1 Tax=Cyprinus carpio TaxID=7962 RepID=A0A8C2GZL7_CYPCA
RRFLYDSLSLCEHLATTRTVVTLTVIISCIFSLDSTDGESEINVRSTATESRWSSSVTVCCIIYEEFRSFSRFLWSHSEALSVSAAALFSADLWRLSRTALPAQLLLSTGGAGGTKLVLAGPTVKPSVSLLPPSSLQISGDSAALLCLLSSYSPQGALVSWTLDGSEVTEGVVTSAESEQDGRYSRSSVLTLSKARWEAGELYVCRVTHDGAPHEASFHKSRC